MMIRQVVWMVFFCLSAVAGSYAAKGDGEQMHLHLAKDFYMPGEIIWFRAYVLDPVSASPASRSHVAYLQLLNADNEPVLQTKFALGPQSANGGSLYIPNHLPSGSYTVVAYTALMKNQGAGHFFRKKINILNPYISPADQAKPVKATNSAARFPVRQALEIKGSLSSPQFAKRSRVDLDLHTLTGGQPVDADLSISVYKVDPLQHRPPVDVFTYGGVQSQPGFQESGRGDITYRPETRYHRLRFRLTDKVSGKGIAAEQAFLSVPGKQIQLYTGTTNVDGYVDFYIREIYGPHLFAVQLHNGREVNVESVSPFFLGYGGEPAVSGGQGTTLEYDPAAYDQGLENLIRSRSLQVQAENSFHARERAQVYMPDLDSLPFYGTYGTSYRLDDYTRFVLMDEVIVEYVKEVRLQRRRGEANLRVLDKGTGLYFDKAPLILLDGIPLPGANEIMAFDPLKIEKIHIVTSGYYLGDAEYAGIVSFSTYDGQLKDFPLPPGITLLDYEGLQYDRVFFHPRHDQADARDIRLPDTRNLLYWQPSLHTGATGQAGVSFFTSDIAGDYVVVIQGISPSGAMGTTLMEFTVK